MDLKLFQFSTVRTTYINLYPPAENMIAWIIASIQLLPRDEDSTT